jgi:hypothetical protein
MFEQVQNAAFCRAMLDRSTPRHILATPHMYNTHHSATRPMRDVPMAGSPIAGAWK